MSVEERLAAYAELVRKWAPKLDLVSPGDLDRLEERHVQDSLRVVPLLDELPPGPCLDVGSGAGFPGIPLAISRPERRWTLVEARQRRSAFLEEVVRELDLNAEVHAKRIELAGVDEGLRDRHVLATARAFTDDYSDIASLAAPLLKADGLLVVFKGEGLRRLPPPAEEWAPGLIIMRKDD